jgi:hypothetical protein
MLAWVSKVAIAVAALDFFDVPPMCAFCSVACQVGGFIEPELVCDIPLGIHRCIAGIVEKGTEKAHRT